MTNPLPAAINFPFVRPGPEAEHELRQHHPNRVAVAALDIGKDVHHLYIRTAAHEDIVPPTKIPAIRDGYQQVIRHVDDLLARGAYDLLVLGHEPTGIYHEAWSHALADRYHDHRRGAATPSVRYRLVHTVLVKQERQRKTHRHRKTDEIDVAAIAELLTIGVGNPVLKLGDAELRLRTRLQYLRPASRQLARQGIQVRTTLERLWPGALGNSKAYRKAHPDLPPLVHLVDSRPLDRQMVRILLQHCPNPYDLCQLGPDGIRQLFHTHDAQCGPKTAQRIYQVAQQRVLPDPLLASLLADQIHDEFALYTMLEGQIAKAEAYAAHLIPQTGAACLLTFPGVGDTLVARYLAGLADPSRFTSPKQIWSFAGFDTLLNQTGNSKQSGKISYRGCPYLRATLFQIGFMAAKHAPPCQETYRRALARDPSKTRAVIHVANKANRIFFAMLRTQQPYTPELANAV